MSEASIPVDLLNPGQVFACVGFLEAADVLLGDARGGFDWESAGRDRFVLQAHGERNPFEAILEFVAKAEVTESVPQRSRNRGDANHFRFLADRNISAVYVSSDEPFAIPDPDSAAKLPALLTCGDRQLVIDHWGDDGTRRDAFKLWAGAQGLPGSARAKEALELVRDVCATAVDDPLNVARPQSSSFGLDWRRDYIPIDAGFSLNSHKDRIVSVGYPLVELFGAIGLTHARPKRHGKLDYTYAILHGLHEPALIRLAIGDPSDVIPFLMRRFRMRLGWPGKEGHSRSITSTTEETQP